MLKFLARRAIEAFDRRWTYDSSYMLEVLDEAGFDAIAPLNGLSKISKYRRGIPAGPYHAAKVAAAVVADCGPCAQLHVSMALADGVDPATLRAVIAGDRAALRDDERLAFDFAKAVLAREPADALRAEILARWKRAGLVSLGYAFIAAEAFPTFKAALGYAHTCSRLKVGDVDVIPRAAAVA